MGFLTALLLLLVVDAPKSDQWAQFPVTSPVTSPSAPSEKKVVDPSAVPSLSTDEVYVINATEPCFLLASPGGLVTVTQEAGPIKIRGRFVGGTGRSETRTFTGAAVFTVEALTTGRVELIVVKVGAKGETDTVRRLVDVNVGPRPPPPPTPQDDPLLAPIQAAWNIEPPATRAADKAKLASVYRTLGKTSLASVNNDMEFFTLVKNATEVPDAPELGIDGRLRGVRDVLAAELKKIMPKNSNAQFTDADRAAASSLLTRFAAVLEVVR